MSVKAVEAELVVEMTVKAKTEEVSKVARMVRRVLRT